MSIIRITEPTSNCVTVAEAKEFSRIRASTVEDTLIESFLNAAESYAENYMKRSIMLQQWRLRIDSIPVDDTIELPRGPISSVATAVSNFSYYDSTNGTNAMPSTSYTVYPDYIVPRIRKAYDASWPTDIRNHEDSVNIEYWTGYPDKASVPDDIKTWIKLRCASYFENRESVMVGSGNYVNVIPRDFIDGLLDRYVVSNL